jgi:Tol biopolymer transport system component
VALITLVLMAAFAFGVNRFLASRQAHVAQAASPEKVIPAIPLPGTMFLAAHGDLFRFDHGSFTELHMPSSVGTWLQPAIVPGSQNVVAVARQGAFADVYLLNSKGQVLRQLSHNATTSSTIQLNHWMFWPRVDADGNTVYVSYDAPKSPQSYEIQFAIWQGTLNGDLAAHQWTGPFSYTGGDTQAVPLAGGGLLYAKYQIDGGDVFSRIAVQTSSLRDPTYLTDPTSDCSEPAVSPDGTMLAMVCTGGTGLQSTALEVAPLQGTSLGPIRTLVSNCLCSAPSWSPDGSGLAYLAPADATGHFQLWWVAGAAGDVPQAPKQVTSGLDFDATSPPAWGP